jgi:hypothetical protein
MWGVMGSLLGRFLEEQGSSNIDMTAVALTAMALTGLTKACIEHISNSAYSVGFGLVRRYLIMQN